MADVTMPDVSARGLAGRPPVPAPATGSPWPGPPVWRPPLVAVGVAGRSSTTVATTRTGRPRPACRPDAASAGRRTQPDATYEGVPVWWSLGQDAGGQPAAGRGLAAARGDRPRVRADRSKAMDRAVVAFCGRRPRRSARRPDGRRAARMSTSPARRRDQAERLRLPAGAPVDAVARRASYLVFPQNQGLEALHGRDRRVERTIDTGDARTLDVSWYADDVVVLPRNGTGATGRRATVDGRPVGPRARSLALGPASTP